jgi:type VI secretion system secreted protein VgrG
VPYYLTIESPVKLKEGKDAGKEAFRLVSFSGHEELSRLFSFTLELESLRDDVLPDEILGKPVSFSVQDARNQPRHFHGYVSALAAASEEKGPRRYRAEVVPWLWFLTRTSDCRIFAGKTVPQIIEAVFDELGFAVYDKLKPSRTYRKWEYCVQYRETDFNFVSRLMEQEGIFYYIKHEKGKHTLVLADSPQGYGSESKEVPFAYAYAEEAAPESVTHWTHQYQFVSGKYTLTDYNFKDQPAKAEQQPFKLLETSTPGKANPKLFDPKKYEIFDYPGEYDDKDADKAYSEAYVQEEDVAYNVVQGSSSCEFFTTGGKFKLVKHPADSENGEYAIASVQHSASAAREGGEGGNYGNSFTCIPADVAFRPARTTRKPGIQGVQTAVVVGPQGSEIHTDEFGRVRVQFFWDRYNTRMQPGGDAKKQAEPVWIRVGQIMAGKNWGAMFIPRVGQEVIVTFLEGNPDQPLVTGVVYNGDQTPPYNPKEEPTKSYIKTNSSTGGKGYNELRFEDKAGKEQVFIHAQRNMDARVGANSMESVSGDRHLIVGGEKDGKKSGDQFEMIYRDKHLKVHRNQVEHIGGDMQLLVGGVDGPGNQDIVVKGEKKELIEKDSHLHAKLNRNEKVDVNQSLTVGGDQQEKVGMNHALEAGQAIHLKGGMTVVIEAGVQLSLKVGGNFVDISPAGVAIQGTMVMINSGGAAGSGAGSSPTAPQDAKEASPTEPTPADSHKSGQTSTTF